MSLLFADSTQHYDTTRGRYKYDFGTPSRQANGGRRGSSCILINGTNFGVRRNIGNQTALFIGAAWFPTAANYFAPQNKPGAGALFANSITPGDMLFSFQYQGVTQCGLCLAPDGSLHVVRGAAFDLGANSLASELMASSDPNKVRFSQWSFIEFGVTPTTAIVRVNNVEVINEAVSTIQDGLPSTFTQFSILRPNTSAPNVAAKVHDIYLVNASGTRNNTFLGDLAVDYLKPDGSGFASDSVIIGTSPAATRWQSVDDATPDDDETAVEFAAEGDADSYSHEDLPYDEATVLAVQGVVYARRQDAGLGAFVHTTRVNATTAEGSITHYPAGGEYAYFTTPFDESADGAWTKALFDDSEFGVTREVFP